MFLSSLLFPLSPYFFLRFIFNNIISPLANTWDDQDVIDHIKHHLLVLTPDVSNLLSIHFSYISLTYHLFNL